MSNKLNYIFWPIPIRQGQRRNLGKVDGYGKLSLLLFVWFLFQFQIIAGSVTDDNENEYNPRTYGMPEEEYRETVKLLDECLKIYEDENPGTVSILCYYKLYFYLYNVWSFELSWIVWPHTS